MKFFLPALFFVCFSFAVGGQNKVPQFKDYPAGKIYKGKNAPVKLPTSDERMFRTRLREAARQKPNFAGHYVLTSWGCGTECLSGAAIDVRTGKVSFFDFSICCWGTDVDDNFKAINFRLDSKLIIFSGARNEKEGDDGAHFYKFENGRFVFIKTVRNKKSQ
jgi:hypothetical protein